MTTVADLVAKLGFQVDTRGFDNFKKSLEAFQSVVREGLRDLKEYAKQAEKISKAFQNSYLPTRAEAKARYNAITEQIKAKAFSQRVRAEWFPKALDIRDRNATSRERSLDLKKRGIESTSNSNMSAILQILKGMAGFSFGGVAGGLASLAGVSHPIVMAISLGVKAIVNALGLVMRTIRYGLRTAMSYRDYMSFTGRGTRGISGLMAASLNATNLTPEDIMRDAAGFEKQYWDMWFGGGNPRFWQLIGKLPTGRGEEDLSTILKSVYGLSGGLKNRGFARSLLSQAGLSEEYITLLEDIAKNNPNMAPSDFFARSREEIASLEEGNKALRELDRSWKELRVELAKALLDSGFIDAIKTIAAGVRKIAGWFDNSSAPSDKRAYQQIQKEKSWWEKLLEGVGHNLNAGYDILEATNPHLMSNTTNINQNFDFGERNMQDAVNGAISITQKTRDTFSGSGLSNDAVMVPTF